MLLSLRDLSHLVQEPSPAALWGLRAGLSSQVPPGNSSQPHHNPWRLRGEGEIDNGRAWEDLWSLQWGARGSGRDKGAVSSSGRGGLPSSTCAQAAAGGTHVEERGLVVSPLGREPLRGEQGSWGVELGCG